MFQLHQLILITDCTKENTFNYCVTWLRIKTFLLKRAVKEDRYLYLKKVIMEGSDIFVCCKYLVRKSNNTFYVQSVQALV